MTALPGLPVDLGEGKGMFRELEVTDGVVVKFESAKQKGVRLRATTLDGSPVEKQIMGGRVRLSKA